MSGARVSSTGRQGRERMWEIKGSAQDEEVEQRPNLWCGCRGENQWAGYNGRRYMAKPRCPCFLDIHTPSSPSRIPVIAAERTQEEGGGIGRKTHLHCFPLRPLSAAATMAHFRSPCSLTSFTIISSSSWVQGRRLSLTASAIPPTRCGRRRRSPRYSTARSSTPKLRSSSLGRLSSCEQGGSARAERTFLVQGREFRTRTRTHGVASSMPAKPPKKDRLRTGPSHVLVNFLFCNRL